MKNSTLRICNEMIHPGEFLSLGLPLPHLYSCAPMYMPIKVVHGKQAGPCLLVTAAMHGNELNGTEIINRLLSQPIIKRLKGTLIAVPVLNVLGLINRTRDLPGGLNFNRSFPGSQSGTNASRTAYLFNHEIFSKADACIDLQTGYLNYSALPQIYIGCEDETIKSLAKSFNAPVIAKASCEEGMLRTLALEQNKPFLTYEAGEAMRFDETSIRMGVKGILNVMRRMEMLPKAPAKKEEGKNFFAKKNIWVRSAASGVSYSSHQLGTLVKKGDTLCVIKDPFGAAEDTVISSPTEGIVVGKNNLPLVNEGECLFELAVFPKMEYAANHLEAWSEGQHETIAPPSQP